MDLGDLKNKKYNNVPLLRMIDNRHGDIPFFTRRYTLKDDTTGFHRHEYMQINYIFKGKGKHVINGHEFDIIQGDIFVIPPYVPHMIYAPDNFEIEIYEFEFEPKFINQNFETIQNIESFFDFAYIEPFLVSENLVKPRLNLVGKVQFEVERIFEEILQEYEAKKDGYILLIRSLLLKLLVIVGREFTAEADNSVNHSIFDRHRDAIFGALKYIEKHCCEELSIWDVARKFQLSQSYFSYLFKCITSKTFTEYVNHFRILKAKEALRNTDKRVIDICYESGFRNVNHFNRIFRQLTGMSPQQYRKSRDE